MFAATFPAPTAYKALIKNYITLRNSTCSNSIQGNNAHNSFHSSSAGQHNNSNATSTSHQTPQQPHQQQLQQKHLMQQKSEQQHSISHSNSIKSNNTSNTAAVGIPLKFVLLLGKQKYAKSKFPTNMQLFSALTFQF